MLGRDFWLFRIGQSVSVIGDSCSSIALSWWVLDATGSVAAMSSVLAPAMFARIFLLPLMGPIGDRFDRKKLVALSNAWRGLIALALAAMAYSGVFQLGAVIALFVLSSVGTALFYAASSALVPRLVREDQLQQATQQSQIVNSVGTILGGMIGGLIVTGFGIWGAFAVDALTFVIGCACALMIAADTRPTGTRVAQKWSRELREGFRLLYRIPVLFWLAVIMGFMNFVFSPIAVSLPVLVKQGRGLPPWFLGALESMIGAGSILGAFALSRVSSLLRKDYVIALGIVMIGAGAAMLPWVPTVALPLVVMFWIGFGSSLANIPLGTQISLATPDAYRARIGAIFNFLSGGMAPLGVSVAGLLIESMGLNWTMSALGSSVFLLTALIFMVPRLPGFLRGTPEQTSGFITRHYPGVL